MDELINLYRMIAEEKCLSTLEGDKLCTYSWDLPCACVSCLAINYIACAAYNCFSLKKTGEKLEVCENALVLRSKYEGYDLIQLTPACAGGREVFSEDICKKGDGPCYHLKPSRCLQDDGQRENQKDAFMRLIIQVKERDAYGCSKFNFLFQFLKLERFQKAEYLNKGTLALLFFLFPEESVSVIEDFILPLRTEEPEDCIKLDTFFEFYAKYVEFLDRMKVRCGEGISLSYFCVEFNDTFGLYINTTIEEYLKTQQLQTLPLENIEQIFWLTLKENIRTLTTMRRDMEDFPERPSIFSNDIPSEELRAIQKIVEGWMKDS